MTVRLQRVAGQALGVGRFAAGIYTTRAQMLYHGLVRGDPLSRLPLPVGRADPRAV